MTMQNSTRFHPTAEAVGFPARNSHNLKWIPDGLGPASAVPVYAMTGHMGESTGVHSGVNIRHMFRDYLLYEKDVLDMFPKWKSYAALSVCLSFMVMIMEDTERSPKYLFSKNGRYYFTDPYSDDPKGLIEISMPFRTFKSFLMRINDFYNHNGYDNAIKIVYADPYEEQVKLLSEKLCQILK